MNDFLFRELPVYKDRGRFNNLGRPRLRQAISQAPLKFPVSDLGSTDLKANRQWEPLISIINETLER